MKTRTVTQSAILLAIGTILHLIPGFVNMVKPDFMLVCVFTIILLNRDIKTAIAVGVAGGILAGITTNAPGGFVPNFVDKLVSSLFVYLGSKFVLENKVGNLVSKAALYFLGTCLSGFVFLLLMNMAGALPDGIGIKAMFIAVVLPTAAVNIAVGLFFDKIVSLYNKRLA